MSKALRIKDYLQHILTAMERIERYTNGLDESAFLGSHLVQDAVIRNIEIIGEAANSIQRFAPAFAAQHDDIPWLVMYTMRNRLAHGYDEVDLEIVWRTIRRDLPGLYAQVSRLSEALI